MTNRGRFWEDRWNRLRRSVRGAGQEPVSLGAQTSSAQADAFSRAAKLDAYRQLRSRAYYRLREWEIVSLLKQLGVTPQSVIDVGAGAGHWSEFCHRKYGVPYEHILALDISGTALSYVGRRCPGINTMVAELGTGQLQDVGHFDCALAIGVLHHVINFDRLVDTLREIMAHVEYLIAFPVHRPARGKKELDRRRKQSHYKEFWTREDYERAVRKAAKQIELAELRVGRLRYHRYLVLRSAAT